MTYELPIEAALRALGEQLDAAGAEARVVVVGGAALILSRVVSRATRDVDVLALAVEERGRVVLTIPEPVPPSLARAIATVARDLGLPLDWMNTQVAGQWQTGLPPGIETRIEWRRFDGLRLGIAGRVDLVFLKLYAAADAPELDSRHTRDLLALKPDAGELEAARAWIATQDPTIDHFVTKVIAHVRDTLR